jgi:hypothetical protein
LAAVFVILTICANIAARGTTAVALIFFFALSFGCGAGPGRSTEGHQ